MSVREILTLCAVIFIPLICNGETTSEQVEDRLTAFEDRVDVDIKYKREAMLVFANKLDQFSKAFSESLNGNFCRSENEVSGDDSTQFTNTFREISELVPLVTEVVEKVKQSVNGMKKEIGEIVLNVKSVLNETTHEHQKLIEYIRDGRKLRKRFGERSNFSKSFDIVDPNIEAKKERLKSCRELYKKGYRISGQYDVYLEGKDKPIRVYCDQDTDEGGWTVFQRRKDGSENFYRGWSDYEHGFGDLDNEFWLGNEHLSALTSTCCQELRIDMENFHNVRRHAVYGEFKVGSKDKNYKLRVSKYMVDSDAGNCLRHHSGSSFSTYDRDNDKLGDDNCAMRYKGAWWYNSCYYANLNGQYLARNSSSTTITWPCSDGHDSLKFTEMKFR